MPGTAERPRLKITTETAKRYIARYANAEEAVRRLLQDNFGHRERQRENVPPDVSVFQRENEDLQRELDDVSAKLPKEGEVVVSKADADALVKYKALGTPEEVDAKVKKSGELETKLTDKDREEIVRTAAKAAGYNENVLLDQVRSRGLTIEMRDHTVDGKTVKAPFVKGSAKDAPFELLTVFVDRDLKEYLPALKAAATTTSTTSTQTGVPFPAQTPEGSAPTGDAADKFLAKRNANAAARPNPLASPAATTQAAAK